MIDGSSVAVQSIGRCAYFCKDLRVEGRHSAGTSAVGVTAGALLTDGSLHSLRGYDTLETGS
jgi:hypothetical protein